MSDAVHVDAPHILEELITKALKARASDIHIEPYLKEFRIRFRIDGLLYDSIPLERLIGTTVIARIKVLAHLNTAERRLPQDGTFSFSLSEKMFDIRVATFPCAYGEKVVLRLLDRSGTSLGLKELGFVDDMLSSVAEIARRSSGFFIVTGPTGSGKTTTLYALLASMATPEKNSMTLEDPIEYMIEGVVQTQVMPEIGLTFEKGIRSLLRQDPDIIMVGEIRDRETAHVAIQAALTGHFVVSTLHTTDALGALIRLIDMGIEPFLLTAAVTGIVAQRLARRLCNACKYQAPPSREERKLMEKMSIVCEQLFTSTGCAECGFTGYRGRIGLFQLLSMSSSLRSLCMERPAYEILCQQAYQEGMMPLIADAAFKVNQGLISFSELMRVI